MGMDSGGGKPGAVQSSINVTPLIDVLLVLLIIFLVVMPIMMKMETLNVPRKIDDKNEMPDPNASQLNIKVEASLDITFNEGDPNQNKTLKMGELRGVLQEKLKALKSNSEKVVFVDFNEKVPWREVVRAMDTIRSLANDPNHDEIKVALKIKDPEKAAP